MLETRFYTDKLPNFKSYKDNPILSTFSTELSEIEPGIYLSGHNAEYTIRRLVQGEYEVDSYSVNIPYGLGSYGVADNVEQIKKHYSKLISNKKRRFIITVTPVYQERHNKGNGGGWRWHKWGAYIGDLQPQCEYLDDEDFGDDFEYILCYHVYELSKL